MTTLIRILPAALLAIAAMAQPAPPQKTQLKVGDMAPDFSFPANLTSNRQAVKLSDFRGKKNVIVAFFPVAFTGG